jgi:hypothetical protein
VRGLGGWAQEGGGGLGTNTDPFPTQSIHACILNKMLFRIQAIGGLEGGSPAFYQVKCREGHKIGNVTSHIYIIHRWAIFISIIPKRQIYRVFTDLECYQRLKIIILSICYVKKKTIVERLFCNP